MTLGAPTTKRPTPPYEPYPPKSKQHLPTWLLPPLLQTVPYICFRRGNWFPTYPPPALVVPPEVPPPLFLNSLLFDPDPVPFHRPGFFFFCWYSYDLLAGLNLHYRPPNGPPPFSPSCLPVPFPVSCLYCVDAHPKKENPRPPQKTKSKLAVKRPTVVPFSLYCLMLPPLLAPSPPPEEVANRLFDVWGTSFPVKAAIVV